MPTSFLAIVLTLAAQVKDTEDVPVARDKWKSEYTEKTWGLKLKTVKYEKLPPTVSVVFEFTKDLQPDETKALNACFFKKEGGLEFCFFDEDGVILAKVPATMYVLQGDVTGMKGDAIRCKIGLNVKDPANFLNSADQTKKVSKVEFRPAPVKERESHLNRDATRAARCGERSVAIGDCELLRSMSGPFVDTRRRSRPRPPRPDCSEGRAHGGASSVLPYFTSKLQITSRTGPSEWAT